jgi:enterochelin esterase-like enzyme
MTERRRISWAAVCLIAVIAGCSNGGGDHDSEFDPNTPPPPLTDSRNFRALTGVSMGAYGAMNLGTKRTDLFGTIASLGGPVDMVQLLHDGITDNLEVKAQTGTLPSVIGDDFTFDHLPPYPERDTRVTMIQDLVLAFGHPYLHHPDPGRLYLASDAEPATIGEDDQFGAFTAAPASPPFLDGGDQNQDGLRQVAESATLATDVLLLAVGSGSQLAGGAALADVGGRELADLDGDGIFDVGDGIVINLSEPFTDSNDNFVFETELGETFEDVGLDGVADTGDFGEGNAQFDYDPDRSQWLAQDPLTRVAARSSADISQQRIYMDVGTRDELGFARHYDNFVAVLEDKGITVDVRDGFSSNCADLPDLDSQFTLIRYDAGHVGFRSVDSDDLANGNVCGEATVWQRILAMMGFLNESFTDGFFGPGEDFDFVDIDFDDFDFDFDFDNLDPRGDVVETQIASPALASAGGAPDRSVLVYRPPAFFHSDERFPVVYFLVPYDAVPDDFRRVADLLDVLILSGQLQNMFFVFLPGDGGQVGSFYVNHAIPETHAPGIQAPTSGRYEDSIVDDLIPAIEDRILERRVRR